MIVDVLFHWSPADRYEDILSNGLRVLSPGVDTTPQFNDQGETTGTEVYLRWPWICFSSDPMAAWQLSGDITGAWSHPEEEGGIRAWDLWQITTDVNDEIHIRPEFGNRIEEVRIHNGIPVDRIRWVARREYRSALELAVDEGAVFVSKRTGEIVSSKYAKAHPDRVDVVGQAG